VHPHIERVVSSYELVIDEMHKEFGFLMLLVGDEDLQEYIERTAISRPTRKISVI
jgi:hypothetical protein